MSPSHDDGPHKPTNMPDKQPPPKDNLPTPPTPASQTPVWGIVMVILGAAALIASLFISYQTHQRLETVHTAGDGLSSQLKLLSHRVDDTAHISVEASKRLDQTVDALEKRFNKRLQTTAAASDEWRLASARFHLELAQGNATAGGEVSTTLLLLKQADEQLVETSHDDYAPIRTAIKQDIATLQDTPKVNTIALLQQLDDARQSLGSLPFQAPTQPMQIEPNSPSWKQHLEDAAEQLKHVVVIQHHSPGLQNMPLLANEPIARHAIGLYLREAQLALVQHNADLYQWTLAQAIKGLEAGFDQNNAKTKALIGTLQTLKSTPISVPVTEISALKVMDRILSASTTAQQEGDEA